jgi:hypothetical protein
MPVAASFFAPAATIWQPVASSVVSREKSSTQYRASAGNSASRDASWSAVPKNNPPRGLKMVIAPRCAASH